MSADRLPPLRRAAAPRRGRPRLVAAVAAGLLAANHIADNCRPGADDEDAAEPSSFGSTESGMSSQLS